MPPESGNVWLDGREPSSFSGPLTGEIRVDTAIVGGGYTGLSTALHLAESGRDVAVIEAESVGFGASGRNGGQVIPGLKLPRRALRDRFGPTTGSVMADLADGTADLVFALVDRLNIACAVDRGGWIQPAHNGAAADRLRQRVDLLREDGADVAWLDTDEVAQALGTRAYHGGLIDRRAGTLQPMLFAEGLARACVAAGASVLDRSRAISVRRTGERWQVATPSGCVVADWLVIATNGYADGLWPKLRHATLSVESAQVATEILPPEISDALLPGCAAVSDSRRLLLYFRKSPDGRFLIGGRGAFLGTTSPSRYAELTSAAESVFPSLKGVTWTHAWSGRVALTPDGLPRINSLAERAIAAYGYNGRGVAMATALGREIASLILDNASGFPLSGFKPLPLPAFHRLAGAVMVGIYRGLDRIR